LPMLDLYYARDLVAPVNAVPMVKESVARQGGFVADLPQGHGVAQGLRHFLEKTGAKTGKKLPV
jgi:hypothetical protein